MNEWRARLTKAGLEKSRIPLELTPTSLNNSRASILNPVERLDFAGSRLHLASEEFGILLSRDRQKKMGDLSWIVESAS